MNRPCRTVVGVVLLLALIGVGFASGKAIGSRLRPHNDSSLSPWIPGSSIDNSRRSMSTAPPSEVFASVLDKVQQDYVSSNGSAPPSNERLTEGALGRMFASLQDSHTFYLNPSQTESRINAILGTRSGIGAELTIVTSRSKPDDIDTSFLTVKSTAPGGPAERAGLRPGDRITEINGRWVIGYPVLSESARGSSAPPESKHDDSRQQGASQIKPGISAARAIQLLTTGVGKSLLLTVAGYGRTAAEQIHINTCEMRLPMVEHKLRAPGVTYLRINGFNAEASSEIDVVLGRQQDWSTGIVIDLRQNSGGIEASSTSKLDGYHCALDLVSHLALKADIGQIENRPGVRVPIKVTDFRPPLNRGSRVAVLIDGGTSNIAEMAAAGMRDAGGAVLIGSHTFGDDNLQYLAPLNSGGAVELTSAHLFTLSGRDLIAGVSPDIPVDSAANINLTADPALRRALRIVCGQ